MQRSIPNMLTLLRIIIIPFLVWSFYIGGPLSHWIAATLFFIAGITDYFDGKLARAWKVESKMGQLLDPIADKLLVVTALMMLVYSDRADELAALIIICREIAISGLREFLAQTDVSVPVSKLAKVKTAAQMLAIFLLILGHGGTGEELTYFIGTVFLWIAATLTLITGYAYFKAGIQHITDDSEAA